MSSDEKVKLLEHIDTNSDSEIKVYRKRWLVLVVFFLHLAGTNLAWINVGSIATEAECYYNVNVFWINSLSYVFFVTYLMFFGVATWFLERYGLRWSAIIGGCFNAAGTWLRFAGADPDYFWLLLLGQVVCSVTNILEWSAPSLLSAKWFPPNERAFATASVGATAPQVGILISLLLSPLIVHSPNTDIVCNNTVSRTSVEFLEWKATIHSQMFYYLLGQAIFATLLLPLTFITPDVPPTPPSVSTMLEETSHRLPLLKSISLALKNCYFLTFVVIFGIFLGVSGAYVTVFDEVLNQLRYDKYQQQVGYLGLAIQVTCIIGLLFIGRWLDWTKTFYGSTCAVCITGTLAAIGFALSLQFQINFYIVSVLCALAVGLVVTFQGVGYEFGVEMTFPVAESVSAGLLNAVSQVIATLMTLACSEMLKRNLAVYVNWFLAGFLLVATLMQFFVRPNLRRVELDGPASVNLFQCCSNKSSINETLNIQQGKTED